MRPICEENEETLEISENISSHISPHLASPILGSGYTKDLQQMCPANPVIPAPDVHPDVNYALRSMLI